MSDPAIKRLLTARTPILVGLAALFVLIGGFGYWSVEARIAGAVIASGTVQVEGHRQVVEHPEGGVVVAINARNGDIVLAGDVILQLDPTRLQSELTIVEGQLQELLVRKARFIAERDGLEEMPGVETDIDLPRPASDVIAGERRLFEARASGLAEEAEQIDEQIAQIENRILGIGAEAEALDQQIVFAAEDLSNQRSLLEQQLTQASQVLGLGRDLSQLRGQRGRLDAEIAELRGQIAAARIQKVRLTTARREEATTELRDLEFREIELVERRIDLKDRIARLTLRAPVSGVVFGSVVDAPQSVVRPADPVLYIVPQDQPVVIEARLNPIDIDQVFAGQEAVLRLTALDQRTTPEISGVVRIVSADAVLDQATGLTYYSAEIMPAPEGLELVGRDSIVPGMPVEAFIQTNERSPIDYLTKPLTDYIARAMRG
ncbi:MAG: HlyD family type I secretion periplasmic adaptor subunit [Pseudomonadota bacterium]